MHILERLYIIDGKHAEKALAGPHVLIPHGAVLLLTCSVQDVQETRLAIDHHLLPVRVLYGEKRAERPRVVSIKTISGRSILLASQSYYFDATWLNESIMV